MAYLDPVLGVIHALLRSSRSSALFKSTVVGGRPETQTEVHLSPCQKSNSSLDKHHDRDPEPLHRDGMCSDEVPIGYTLAE